MIRRAAGDDHDLVDGIKLPVVEPQPFQLRRLALEAFLEHLAQHPGLLVDLLEHEMRVALFLDRVDLEGHGIDFRLDRLAAKGRNIDLIFAQDRQLAVFKIDDLAGMF